MGTYQPVVNVEFSGSHFLRGYDGCCSHMHGHNFKVQAKVCGDKLNEIGILIDFKAIKTELKKIVAPLGRSTSLPIGMSDALGISDFNAAERLGIKYLV